MRSVNYRERSEWLSGELPLTYLPFYSLLSLSLSIYYSLIPSTFTGLVVTVTVMVTVT
jgi:hypothetical protein